MALRVNCDIIWVSTPDYGLNMGFMLHLMNKLLRAG